MRLGRNKEALTSLALYHVWFNCLMTYISTRWLCYADSVKFKSQNLFTPFFNNYLMNFSTECIRLLWSVLNISDYSSFFPKIWLFHLDEQCKIYKVYSKDILIKIFIKKTLSRKPKLYQTNLAAHLTNNKHCFFNVEIMT